MSDQDSIGEGLAPFFSVDAVTLELQVTIRKDAKAGLKVYVAELGGGLGRDPERWKEVERAAR